MLFVETENFQSVRSTAPLIFHATTLLHIEFVEGITPQGRPLINNRVHGKIQVVEHMHIAVQAPPRRNKTDVASKELLRPNKREDQQTLIS